MKPVYLSNLNMRFYIADGWTKPELDECCKRGSVKRCTFEPLRIDPDNDYFALSPGSYFESSRLADKISTIHPMVHTEDELQELHRLSVEQIIERYQ